MSVATPLDAIEAGKAFADLSHWHKIDVSGPHAIGRLGSLVGADLSDLGPGRARQVHVHDPERDVTVDLTVTVPAGRVLLLQDPAQPVSILDLLSTGATDAGVRLDDRSDAFALFAVPHRPSPPPVPGTGFASPSCLGPGFDVVALAADREHVRAALARSATLLTVDQLAAWRAIAAATAAPATPEP